MDLARNSAHLADLWRYASPYEQKRLHIAGARIPDIGKRFRDRCKHGILCDPCGSSLYFVNLRPYGVSSEFGAFGRLGRVFISVWPGNATRGRKAHSRFRGAFAVFGKLPRLYDPHGYCQYFENLITERVISKVGAFG